MTAPQDPVVCWTVPGEMRPHEGDGTEWWTRCGCGVLTCERGTAEEAEAALTAHRGPNPFEPPPEEPAVMPEGAPGEVEPWPEER